MISRFTWLNGFIFFVKNHQHPRPRSSSAAETREYPKSCLQKFVFAAPQLPSTGPNLLGERLRFSSTSGGWWRVNRFRWRRWNARWRKIALHLVNPVEGAGTGPLFGSGAGGAGIAVLLGGGTRAARRPRSVTYSGEPFLPAAFQEVVSPFDGDFYAGLFASCGKRKRCLSLYTYFFF